MRSQEWQEIADVSKIQSPTMNNYIRFEGTREQMVNLPAGGNYEVRTRSANQLGTDLWEAFAMADTASIAAFRAAGLTVEILISEDVIDTQQIAMNEHLRQKGIDGIA